MPPIVSTVEIDRPPDEVFPYVIDPSHFGEWQIGVVSGELNEATPAVGSRCTTTRRIGGSNRTSTGEITELSPPHSWSVRGLDGPIRANVDVIVDPLDEGVRSRVTIAVDFKGHGIGKALVPLFVRGQAAKEVPVSCRNLKEQLERPQ